jgi:hypothetical protein
MADFFLFFFFFFGGIRKPSREGELVFVAGTTPKKKKKIRDRRGGKWRFWVLGKLVILSQESPAMFGLAEMHFNFVHRNFTLQGDIGLCGSSQPRGNGEGRIFGGTVKILTDKRKTVGENRWVSRRRVGEKRMKKMEAEEKKKKGEKEDVLKFEFGTKCFEKGGGLWQKKRG